MVGDKTGISWTDSTWNPVIGCTMVSEGCRNCYAMKLALTRLTTSPGYAGMKPWTPANEAINVRVRPAALEIPLHWRAPRRIFVNSMSDLFHEAIPWDYVARVFAVMARTPRHQYQVLTKRPEYMRALLTSPIFVNEVACYAPELLDGTVFPWPLPNVWLGTSIEKDRYSLERAQALAYTPAAVRFVSLEPMLDRIDPQVLLWSAAEYPNQAIHWVIAGGESGGPPQRSLVEPAGKALRVQLYRPKPWALEAMRELRDYCREFGVAFHFKQWGGPKSTSAGHLLDGVEHQEYPEVPDAV